MTDIQLRIDHRLAGYSMILGPLIFAASTFFWNRGEYGVTGGSIIMVAMVFWIIAFTGVFSGLQSELPVYASLGLVVAIYGCLGGMNFGIQGFTKHFLLTGSVRRQPMKHTLQGLT